MLLLPPLPVVAKPASPPPDRRAFAASFSGNGFTLIELLVVIAVIGILAGLLFPALGAAKRSSEAASCASSLRQIGLMNMTYAAEHKNWYVPIHQPGADGSGLVWWYQNPDFRDLTGIQFPYYSGGANYPADFVCSAATWAQKTATDGYPRIDRCYGFNETGLLGLRGYQGVPLDQMGPYGVRVNEVSNPARVIEMTDALSHSVGRVLADAYRPEHDENGPAAKETAYRHNGKANVLFFDGHVEALGRDVLADTATNTDIWTIK